MLYRKSLMIALVLLFSIAAVAKNKKKVLLPVDVLRAHNVLVVVEPNTGVDPQDPNANRMARQDVEQALAAWGRFTPVSEANTADLIITVRKGHERLAQPTIGGTPINGTPPAVFNPSDSSPGVSARHGNSGIPGDPSNTQSSNAHPYPGVEMGPSQDTFVVYRGNTDNPLNAPPVWRYMAKDALESPAVPAVIAFRKLIEESDRQEAGTP